jgi:hypothetical protein
VPGVLAGQTFAGYRLSEIPPQEAAAGQTFGGFLVVLSMDKSRPTILIFDIRHPRGHAGSSRAAVAQGLQWAVGFG